MQFQKTSRCCLRAVCTAAMAVVMAGFSAAPSAAAREPYERLLPLSLSVPAGAATAGQPWSGVVVRLQNPGNEAPAARLRLLIRGANARHGEGEVPPTPANVRVEVQEPGGWVPVSLGVVDGGVIGAIGIEGRGAHVERHQRGGFTVMRGLNKSWPLRITFDQRGSYALVVSVSPDNGSQHLAQPVFATIEVR